MSFRLKLLLSFLGLIVLCLAVVYVSTERWLDSFYQKIVAQDIEYQARTLIPLLDFGSPELDALVDEVTAGLPFRVTVIEAGGEVIADSSFSGSGLDHMDNHGNRPEVVEAFGQGTGRAVRFSTSTHLDFMYLAVLVPGWSGVLRVAMPLADIERDLASLQWQLAARLLPVLVAVSAAVWLISRRLTAGLRRLGEAAAKMQEGDFPTTIPISSGDDFGMLARSMEKMSAQIGKQVSKLQSERSHLTTVLNGMSEGVLTLGRDGRVSGTNPAFLEIFRLDSDPLGQKPIEVIRDSRISQGLEEVLATGQSRQGELQVGGKILAAHFAPLKRDQETLGAVAVFHDISEIRRLERARKDFISNVSHELKTPLTSIQGYTETLLATGGVPPVEKDFLKKIYDNATQLALMIDDLFALARLEQGADRPVAGPVDFEKLMASLKSEFAGRLAEKGLELTYSERTQGLELVASQPYLRTVLYNLLENATKYSQSGVIEVSLERTEADFLFSVRDSGIGIPDEDLDRIFERFYRVNKDRNKRTGGRGIGLAIVKHIIQLHGGKVWAESRLGEGTRIRFTIPVPGQAGKLRR